MKINLNSFDKISYYITNLKPRKTLRPSRSSNIMSTTLAETIIKSKMFQPHRKKSFDSAISLTMHSNAKTDVNTWKKGKSKTKTHQMKKTTTKDQKVTSGDLTWDLTSHRFMCGKRVEIHFGLNNAERKKKNGLWKKLPYSQHLMPDVYFHSFHDVPMLGIMCSKLCTVWYPARIMDP